MRRGLVALVTLAGCSFTSPGGSPDASTVPGDPDARTQDTPDSNPGADCFAAWRDHSIALTAGAPLANLNSTAEDRDPFVSADELTLFFASRRGGTQGADVFVATRLAITDDFGTPTKAGDFNTSSDDTKMAMTANGLVAVVASGRGGGEGADDLWISTRGSPTASFPTFDQTGLGAVNDGDEQLDPQLSDDGLTLAFAVHAFPQHIAIATRTAIGDAFDAPQTLIDTPDGDADPVLSPDGLVIVFSSNRTGSGFAGSNLWYATRGSTSAQFGAAQPVPTVNGNGNEGDPVLSRDGCRLYFAVDAGIASYELVMASAR